MEDTDMQLISAVAKATGVSPDTIRWWGKNKLLSAWDWQPTVQGSVVYYTTIQAVLDRKAHPPKRGRPRKQS